MRKKLSCHCCCYQDHLYANIICFSLLFIISSLSYILVFCIKSFPVSKMYHLCKVYTVIETDWRYLDLHLYKVFQNLLHEQIVCAHQRSEWGMMMGNCPPGQPWEENHLWTANRTSMWNIPSSVSSSGNMADPSDLEARSIWPRLTLCSDPDGGLFMAPSRFSGVLSSVESKQKEEYDVRKKLTANKWLKNTHKIHKEVSTQYISSFNLNIFCIIPVTLAEDS